MMWRKWCRENAEEMAQRKSRAIIDSEKKCRCTHAAVRDFRTLRAECF